MLTSQSRTSHSLDGILRPAILGQFLAIIFSLQGNETKFYETMSLPAIQSVLETVSDHNLIRIYRKMCLKYVYLHVKR